MRRALLRQIVLAAVLATSGCRRPSVASSPAPSAAVEEYCWWHVMSSPMHVDTVAARFASAFTAFGLRDVRRGRQADTAWATASLTDLGGQPGSARYAGRMVGYQKGDSTHFRSYVTVQAPLRGSQPVDTADETATGGHIAACNAIARAAAVHASAPAAATGEEALKVWDRKQ